MATIITKNSTGSGVTPSSLIQGELAINVVDGKLFYGSGSGNVVKEFSTNTGSLLTTASVSLNTITFTKGDGSTFPITVNTGSGGGGSTFPYTGSAIVSGSLTVTGSIKATDGITGSLNGTATRAIASDQIYIAENTSPGTYSIPVYPEGGYDGDNTLVNTNISYDYVTQALTVSRITASNGLYISNSINSVNRQLTDNSSKLSIDWQSRALRDSTEFGSVDWENRAIYDSAGGESINWNARRITDDAGNVSVQYQDRQLLANDGATPALDWRTVNQLTVTGHLIPGGTITDNTSSYDLGSVTAAWRDLYVSNGSIKMISGSQSASISFTNGALDFGTTPISSPDVIATASVSSNTITFTKGDGTTFPITVNTGSGGSPGGNSNEIQYNNGVGGFAGAANVEISTNGNLNLVAQTDPSTPAAGVMSLYSKDIASRIVPKVKGPSGLDYALQSSLWQNEIYYWTQTTATNGVWQGTSGAGAGTFSSVTGPTINGTGTIYQSIRRARYANVVTTPNQPLGQRNTDSIFFRGAATGQGGFFFYTRCGFDVWTNGGRFFAGMATSTVVITSNPSTLNNTVGFCVNDTDNGAISFLTRNAATSTKVSTGLTISSNKGYDIFIFNAPNSGTIGYRIIDINTGTEFSGTTTTTLPAAGVGLTANVLASNAALTPVTSIQLGVVKIYIEVDY